MTMNLFQHKTIKLSAMREAVQRDGKCFDRIIMGILWDEWIELQD
ncbi:TPA: GNAT family acetyltransferase [Bacillus cereus]|nr:GNAT family acetyltransferase [Bacillus cereus]HDR4741836.1 GNAT family acetyltransferase [Bacillus cereus]HDR4747147.1 GNAT family acetyltransferase [Bacillus cereus]HDR4752897.1 GNAT family acetyltransferase [Bacillus cereus]HDR4769833.1 GNAT family acetyltransferase [Bacillus cereus]